MWDINKSLLIFRTLPDVPTGGNLTATIIAQILNLPNFKDVEDFHINIDGAGDNVNYTFLYSLVHFLLSAKKRGWD